MFIYFAFIRYADLVLCTEYLMAECTRVSDSDYNYGQREDSKFIIKNSDIPRRYSCVLILDQLFP